MLLTIPELLQNDALAITWQGAGEASAENIMAFSTDTRTLTGGQVFVAIVGENHDAHTFIGQAFEKGANACLVNHSWYQEHGKAHPNGHFLVVHDTLVAYQEIARYYRLKFDIPVIALTGSSGKTTSKELISSVLAEKYNVLSNIKSFNNHIGVPATLLNLRPEHEIMVNELGTNNFGELLHLSYLVNPSVCLFTNIGSAHMERFENVQGVTRAKMEMLDGMQPDGTVIYNADDEVLSGLTFPTNKVLSYGTANTADVKGVIQECDDRACYRFELDKVDIKLALPGRHNVANALAAAAAGTHLGLNTQQIKRGIESCDYIEKRMHVIDAGRVRVIDDTYNANPGSCRAALDTLSDMTPTGNGRRIAVLGDMLELGPQAVHEHASLLAYAKQKGIASVFLYGELFEQSLDQVEKQQFDIIEHFTNREDLRDRLSYYMTQYDLVLIKGSRSMQMERIVCAIKAIEEE